MSRTGFLGTGLAAGALGLTLLAAACGSSGNSPSGGPSSLNGKTIALVGYGSGNPWGAYFNKVFMERLSSTGVEIKDLTTMDPGTRTLQRVTIDDAALAERIFTELMGDKVEPRKAFIERHAKEVRFLDV